MKSIKRILAITIIATMLVSCFAVNASADAIDYHILVGGTNVTSINANGVTGTGIKGKVTYDVTSKTLTLEDAKITCNTVPVIVNDGGVTIAVKGNCEVNMTDVTGCGVGTSMGAAGSTLTIIGEENASLTINTKGTSGIYCGNCGFTIKNLNLVVNNTNTEDDTHGLYAVADIVIENSKLDVNVNSESDGIESEDGDLTIKNSKIEMTRPSRGLFGNNITIDNSTIDIASKDSSILAKSTVNFKGKSNVNCFCTDDPYCVFAAEEILFNLTAGGIVTAEANCAEDEPAAFIAAEPQTIKLASNNKVTYPKNGAATKLNIGSLDVWVIAEADGTTFASKATVECPLTEYEIKEQEQTATWTKGGKDGAVLTSNAVIDKFVSVTVDGTELVENTDFTKESGSTIITFKPAYLEALSVGKHTVVINSNDGYATGYLVIKEDQKVAQTGDNNTIAVFAAIGALSAAGFVALKKKED